MGDPRKQHKKYEEPRFPWSTTDLNSDLILLGEYGLRNKKELWRHRYQVSKYRAMARRLLARPSGERIKLEEQLLSKLKSMNAVSENSDLDDVLDLSVENLLERRIQTLVYRKGLARTPYQARQMVVHGHVSVGGRRVTSPSYIVSREEETEIQYAATSVYAQADSSAG